MPEAKSISIWRMVLIPAVITLAVTILRLVGELQGWPKLLFNTEPGGGFAVVGIVWLVPVFGIYFALKLANAGERPRSLGKAAGIIGLALILFLGSFGALAASSFTNAILLLAGAALVIAAMLIPLWGWNELAKVLLAYAFAARIPVAIINFLSLRGSWGTHYEGAPPGFPEMSFWSKYLVIGFLPQMTAWIAYTVIVGGLFGVVAVSILRRPSSVTATG